MKTLAILFLLFLCPFILPAQNRYSIYAGIGVANPMGAYASKSDANKYAGYAKGGFSATIGFMQQSAKPVYGGGDVMLYSNSFDNTAFDQSLQAKTGAKSNTLATSYKGIVATGYVGYMFFKTEKAYVGAHLRVGFNSLATPAIDNTTTNTITSVRIRQQAYRSFGSIAGLGIRLGADVSTKVQFIFMADYLFGTLNYYGVQTDTYVNGAYQTSSKNDESVKMRNLFLHFGLSYCIN